MISISRLLRASAGCGLALLCIGATPAPVGQGAGQGRTYGFMLRTLYYPVPADPAACPSQSLGSLEMFAQSLPPAERERFGKPEAREELRALMGQRLGFRNLNLSGTVRADAIDPAVLDEARRKLGLAPGKGVPVSLGARFAYDSCSNPEDFPQFDAGNQTYLGKVSIGANLDGKEGRNDFVGPDGARGIDNGLLRATGCNLGVQDYGDTARGDRTLFSQTAPTALEITGVDDLVNDDDVTVSIHAAAQSLDVGADGDALRWASVDLDPNPRYSATAKARIVGGVLTTEPFAFTVRQKESVVEAYRSFVGTRLRITLRPDGTIAGELLGYQTLESLDYQFRHLSQVAADYSRTSCPAILSAIQRFADGFRDRKTGRFTAISAAYRFNGVPAYLVHAEGTPQ